MWNSSENTIGAHYPPPGWDINNTLDTATTSPSRRTINRFIRQQSCDFSSPTTIHTSCQNCGYAPSLLCRNCGHNTTQQGEIHPSDIIGGHTTTTRGAANCYPTLLSSTSCNNDIVQPSSPFNSTRLYHDESEREMCHAPGAYRDRMPAMPAPTHQQDINGAVGNHLFLNEHRKRHGNKSTSIDDEYRLYDGCGHNTSTPSTPSRKNFGEDWNCSSCGRDRNGEHRHVRHRSASVCNEDGYRRPLFGYNPSRKNSSRSDLRRENDLFDGRAGKRGYVVDDDSYDGACSSNAVRLFFNPTIQHMQNHLYRVTGW